MADHAGNFRLRTEFPPCCGPQRRGYKMEPKLAALRHHLSGETRHRLPDHRVVHDPALVEVADELVHPVFAAQRLHPLDAVIGIAEDPHPRGRNPRI